MKSQKMTFGSEVHIKDLLLQLVAAFQLLLFSSHTHAQSQSQYTPIFSFNGTANGSSPVGSLIFDGTYLYGMTSQGGANNFGRIFKIKPDGSGYEKILDFDGGNGRLPQGSLIFDGTFLYGMTIYGGSRGTGAMFKIKPDGTEYTKLWDFGGLSFGMPNAAYPYGSLLLQGGYLYGMASFGGINAGGVIFKIRPDGTGFSKLRDLYAGGIVRDGADPWGSLISDGTYLYGTARLGGIGLGGGWPEGAVFKIKPDGTGYSKLFDCTGANGSEPTGDLLYDGNFLYGTTSSYGSGGGGAGTVFRVKPDGSDYLTLHNFDGATGRLPRGSLISDGTFLYGMTSEGGANNLGTLFKIKPDGSGFKKLMSFNGASTGSSPALGSLVSDGSYLYGMTFRGGANNLGVLFKYSLEPWPSIDNFTPAIAPVGTTVTITGTNFDPTEENNVVLFNGTQADVTASTETSITTSVPMGATTGQIKITVGKKATSSETDFTVSPPSITSFSPIAGPPETLVTIIGINFDPKSSNNIVKFNGTPAFVKESTSTSITVKVPAGATTGNITVTVGSNSAISPISFKVIDLLVFAPKVDYPVYYDPREVKVADFNLDGHLDFATPSSGAIAIRYGTGAGCFDTKLDVLASLTLTSIAAADLNFDGWIDLVGANASTGNVSVFINSGSGFHPPFDYASGPESSTLSIGDVNGDGIPDLVVVNDDTSGSISILLNNGWGEFLQATQYPTASNPNSVSIGDVNGDSRADLAITNSSQSISIFLNDGTGGFPNETQYLTTKTSNGTVLNDFDHDSDLDVAIASTDGNSIDIMLNDGSGLYSTITDFQTNTPGYGPGSIVAGDFNNDGSIDLLTGVYEGMASILLGDGSGWFAPGQPFPTGNGLSAVNLGDVDEDGFPDVVSANSSDNTVSVLLTSGNACGAPTITGFTPLSGSSGSIVTITGTNFSTTPANNIVKFNGVSALTPSDASATSLTVIVPAGAATGPITVTVSGKTASSSADFCVIPAAPGTISGTTTICSGSTNIYSITPVSGATTYHWTLPSGWTGNSATNSISITASANSGTISITAANACGTSAAASQPVTVVVAPVAPGAISGTTTICSGSTNICSVTPVNGATSYNWTLPNGWTGSSSTNSINTTASANSGTISVTAVNACGSSAAASQPVTVVVVPAAPGAINGTTTICSGSTNTFSVTSVSGASYNWTLPNGWTGASTTNSISTTASITSGIISVTASNECGASASESHFVTVHDIPAAPNVQNPEAVCPGANVTLKATGATSGQYRWYENGILIPTISSSSFTILGIAGNRTFDVSIFSLCESPKTNVRATVVDCTLPPAQVPSVIGSAGGYFTSSQGSLAWTLGEVVTETFIQGSDILTQGFHQPLKYIITGAEYTNDEIEIYPNPVHDWLTIKTKEAGDYRFEIINTNGLTIFDQSSQALTKQTHVLEMSGLPATMYLLRITNTISSKASLHKILKY